MHSADIAARISTWLSANRPTGFPAVASLPIVSERGTTALAAPYLLISLDSLEGDHPSLQSGELILELHTQTDDTAPATSDAWLALIRDLLILTSTVDTLRSQLYQDSVLLKKLRLSGSSAGFTAERARMSSLRFRLLAQLDSPPLS